MAHLRIVPTSHTPPEEHDDDLPEALTLEQIYQHKADNPHLYDRARQRPTPPAPGEYPPLPPELIPPEMDPLLKAAIAEWDALMEGHSREERLAILHTAYRDADGNLRARSLEMRGL